MYPFFSKASSSVICPLLVLCGSLIPLDLYVGVFRIDCMRLLEATNILGSADVSRISMCGVVEAAGAVVHC